MKLVSIARKLYLAVALAAVPCSLTVLLHLYESGPWWELGMLLMPLLILYYVLPFYLLYLELGAAAGRLFDRGVRPDGRLRSRGERRLGYATTAVAVLLALLAIRILSLRDSSIGNPIAAVYLLTYIALPVLWIIGAAVYKKRFPLKDCLHDKGVWIPALVLFLAALTVGAVALCLNLSGGFHPGGVPDPLG